MTDYKWEVTDVFEYIEELVATTRTLAEYDSYTDVLWSKKMQSLLRSLGTYSQVRHLYYQRIETAHKVSLRRQSRDDFWADRSKHNRVLLTEEIIPNIKS
jgi:hypothetical protein